MKPFLKHPVVYWDKETSISKEHKLIGEEPLFVQIQGKPYSVIMRTPGEEIPHVAGFCLAEGIVNDADEFVSLDFSDDQNTNVVSVTLEQTALYQTGADKTSRLFEGNVAGGEKGSGFCAGKMVKELCKSIKPLTDQTVLDIEKAYNTLENLSDHQPLRQITHASHAAALYTSDFELLSVSEDVGRHNALDKSIGKLFIDKKLFKASLLILSSRISCDLVNKAARARIPIILAVSRPTSLGVELAAQLNITLACLARGSGLYIFCGEHRLKR